MASPVPVSSGQRITSLPEATPFGAEGFAPGPLQARAILASSMNKGRRGILKRSFDVMLAFLGLVLSAPLWLFITLAIKLEDGGPVFFYQRRVGRAGRIFRALKFRTMHLDAEKAVGPTLATPGDPRVTRMGRWLRATALDELPQLVNILRGQMSFVGPRPERPEFVSQYKDQLQGYEERFEVLPGLTGLAQIYGHYNSSPRTKLRYDILYLKRGSFWMDLRLILLSFWISSRGRWQVRGRKL